MNAAAKTVKQLYLAGTDSQMALNVFQQIVRLNAMALVIAVVSVICGFIYQQSTGHAIILISTLVEASLFLVTIPLNYFRLHKLARIWLQSIFILACLYLGILFGRAVEFHLVAIFLLVTPLMTMQTRRELFICYGIGVLVLALVELNKRYHYIPSLPISEDAMTFIYYSSIIIVLALTVIPLVYYTSNNSKLIRKITQHNEELEQSNRSKEIFIREITHEIRTPLNALFSSCQLRKIEDSTRGSDQDINDQQYHACKMVLDIVNNVQDQHKLDHGTFEEANREIFHLNEWLVNIRNIYSYSARLKDTDIILEVDEALQPWICQDRVLLTKIVNNLLGNAIKFTHRNTSIYLRAAKQDEGTLAISVTDEGPGIPADRIHTIFDEFTRTSVNLVEGTGLGLNIAKRLALLLQGDIAVKSDWRNGTTFTVTLPLREAGKQPGENIPVSSGYHLYEGRTALIIEDNPMSLLALSRYLQYSGFSVVTAEDGEEGLLQAKLKLPDIIITDLGLPKLDGIRLTACIRKDVLLSHIPIIILSADSDSQLKQEALEAGADEVVVKPFEFPALNIIIKRFLPTRFSLPN